VKDDGPQGDFRRGNGPRPEGSQDCCLYVDPDHHFGGSIGPVGALEGANRCSVQGPWPTPVCSTAVLGRIGESRSAMERIDDGSRGPGSWPEVRLVVWVHDGANASGGKVGPMGWAPHAIHAERPPYPTKNIQ